MRRFLAPGLLALTLACGAPHVLPRWQGGGFKLSQLRNARVAVWPIAEADLDGSVEGTAVKEYGTRNAFLDALSLQLADRIIGLNHADSLRPAQVVEAFKKDPKTLPLLSPDRILSGELAGSRFDASPGTELQALAEQPALRGIRYALIPRGLSIGRDLETYTTAPTMGPNGTFVGGGTNTRATSRARLKLAIVDLESRKLVWDGVITAAASSTIMKATALHEVEQDLGAHLVNEILGKP